MIAAAAQAAAVAGIAEGVAVTAAGGGAATRRLVEAPKRGLSGGRVSSGHLSCTHTVGARARVKGGGGGRMARLWAGYFLRGGCSVFSI
jgi:hypothetical protein